MIPCFPWQPGKWGFDCSFAFHHQNKVKITIKGQCWQAGHSEKGGKTEEKKGGRGLSAGFSEIKTLSNFQNVPFFFDFVWLSEVLMFF